MKGGQQNAKMRRLTSCSIMQHIHPARPNAVLGTLPFLGALIEHGTSLILPLCTLLFLTSGPHSPLHSVLWTAPVWLAITADFLSPRDRRAPPAGLPSRPFDVLLGLLTALQFANIIAMVWLASRLSWSDPAAAAASAVELLAVRILVGTTSCCTGIAVAHELIHRRAPFPRWVGRGLLVTVCYAHFAVEHLRRHHRHVGTHDDPATARLGESYAHYWHRTKFEQFRSAWQLENARLGLGGAAGWSWRLWRHEVCVGAAIEIWLVVLIGAYAGTAAALVFLLQALAAVRLLEAVNYFQHWGLIKADATHEPFDAWVTDSWVSRHVFIGLARHSDHHRYGAKPYHSLEYCARGPRLPFGYFGMALLAKSFNPRFQRIARLELLRYRRRTTVARDPSLGPKPVPG